MTDGSLSRGDALVAAYFAAHAVVVGGGFLGEIEWQRAARPERLTEPELLRESAWVILSAGLSVRAVGAVFPAVSAAFRDWRAADEIERNARDCRVRALRAFNHRPKIDAILAICRSVASRSFDAFRTEIGRDPIGFLRTFAYLGPATSHHLAKNLGYAVAKPDRHLCRLAAASGFDSPTDLCTAISEKTGDAIGVVDLVLWRYATLVQSSAEVFGQLVKRGSELTA